MIHTAKFLVKESIKVLQLEDGRIGKRTFEDSNSCSFSMQWKVND